MVDINLREIRASGARPRCHGNGFVLLDVAPGERLHVWGHPWCPRQRVETPIHDHTFGFTSILLRGQLINLTYAVPGFSYEMHEQPTHRVYTTQRREGTEDTKLMPWRAGNTATMGVSPRPRTFQKISLGMWYSMEPRVFHETLTDRPSATVMIKNARRDAGDPYILVPAGLEPDNDFDKEACDQDLLWHIVEQVMG